MRNIPPPLGNLSKCVNHPGLSPTREIKIPRNIIVFIIATPGRFSLGNLLPLSSLSFPLVLLGFPCSLKILRKWKNVEKSGRKWKGQSLCPPDLLEILDLLDILALLGRPVSCPTLFCITGTEHTMLLIYYEWRECVYASV